MCNRASNHKATWRSFSIIVRKCFCSRGGQWPRERRDEAAFHHQFAVFDFVLVFEKPARRRTGGTCAVFVISATVAWTQEEARLLEPAHRAAQVGAIDGEDLEPATVHAAHQAWNVAGLAVPRPRHR